PRSRALCPPHRRRRADGDRQHFRPRQTQALVRDRRRSARRDEANTLADAPSQEHHAMSTGFDTKTAPPSVFPAHDGAAYEQIMGRWSRRLAPLLIEFGGLADGDRVLDVGCGTGSLSHALPKA